ncbi:MAG: hypothetical protein M3361_08300 [Candidatus Tectomicrobia bacterium]|nr:hypothetical protein [Candidatus Tectomicrobia bacterium]
MMHVDPVMVEPSINTANEALSIPRAALHIGCPGRETAQPGLHQAHHHPGKGLEMPTIQPVSMLDSHLNQGSLETRRAFHVYLP